MSELCFWVIHANINEGDMVKTTGRVVDGSGR